MAGTRARTRSKRKKRNENPKSGLSGNCGKWGHNDASGWHGKEKQVNRVRSSSSSTLVATDVDTKEKGGKRRRELAWYGRWFHNDQSVARGLCDFRVHVCPKNSATHTTFVSQIECMREVVSNEMNLHGEVFTVKVFAVICEGRRRQLLSMIWWEIEGFLLTVGDGCRKLEGHGREMILRRDGDSHLVNVEFKKRAAMV